MIPSGKEVETARQLMRKYLRPTRLVRLNLSSAALRRKFFLKIESDLHRLVQAARCAFRSGNECRTERVGRVAASTGNHGAAVAYAAHREPGGHDLSPGKS